MPIYAFFVMVLLQAWLLMTLYIASRRRRLSQAPRAGRELPPMTIIVPALNEEETIGPAMRSLLELDYPDYEIIAVDDRSTDRTGEILENLAAEHPERLRVIRITELPEGWLGKCHALDAASAHARGAWLLFTDADVVIDRHALRGAMGYALQYDLSHLTLFPQMLWKGYIEAALLGFFAMAIGGGFRIWRVESRSLDAYIGIGAFNMIRRSLYESFDGHRALRMEVADDMKLAYLAKKHGGRSMAVDSEGRVRVRWRQGVRDTVRGLERSAFPGIGFDWFQVIAAVTVCLGVMLAPYILPFFSDSVLVLAPSIVSIVVIIWVYALESHGKGMPVWIGVLHPVAVLLFAYAILRSAVVTTLRGGLAWRGTFYSIAELKKGGVV